MITHTENVEYGSNQNITKSGVMRQMKSMELGLLIVVLLSAVAIMPLVSADENNITINITSPEEGDTFYIDVVPAFISVQGTIDAPHVIRNVSISNGLNESGYARLYAEVIMGIDFHLSCKIFITDHITVTVTDKSGFVGSERRNFTNYPGPPPPGTIWVTGWVVDQEGKPVSNATIIFETLGESPPVIASTKTGTDGTYKTKKTWGYYQKITVKKEEYQTFVRGAVFKIYNNELNLTLTPQSRQVPGFNFEVCTISNSHRFTIDCSQEEWVIITGSVQYL